MNNVDRTDGLSPHSLRANTAVEETTGSYLSRPARAIFVAGLSCGILDITAAFVFYGRPLRLLQGIAYGLLGPQAFDGGWVTGMLGLACHFFVAFCASAVFYLAARKLKFMARQAIPAGIAYGIVVYTVMQAVVIPLSRIGRLPFSLSGTVTGVLIHIVCVGLPISLWMRRFLPYPAYKRSV